MVAQDHKTMAAHDHSVYRHSPLAYIILLGCSLILLALLSYETWIESGENLNKISTWIAFLLTAFFFYTGLQLFYSYYIVSGDGVKFVTLFGSKFIKFRDIKRAIYLEDKGNPVVRKFFIFSSDCAINVDTMVDDMEGIIFEVERNLGEDIVKKIKKNYMKGLWDIYISRTL